MTDPVSGRSAQSRPEVEFVRRLAQGEVTALADLYERHGGAVFSLALRILEDGAEAERVAYEVFAAVRESAHRLDPHRVDLGNWLLLTTRRRALDRRRAREVLARPDEQAVADLPEPAATPDGARLPPDALARLRTALAARPLLERLPIELAYFQGLTHTAIASHLDMRPDLVRTRIRRGLTALRGADDQSTGHEEALELATLYALGAVSPSERRAVQDHLDVCRRCVQEVRALLPTVFGLTRAVPLVEPPATLRARLLASPPPATPQREPRPTAISNRQLDRQPPPEEEATEAPAQGEVRRSSTLVAWVLAVVGLVVAGGSGWYAVQIRQDLVVARERTDQLTSRAALAEAQVAALKRTASETQTALAVLGAPDLTSVELHGQPAAPQASGRLFWSRTRGLFITATHLPPAPRDRAYQIWFVPPTSQNVPVRVGQVRPDEAGRVNASLATPPDLTAPLLVFLTLEPPAGATSPSGEHYLASAPAPAAGRTSPRVP